MISPLLESYPRPETYTVISSTIVNGHEVAWMEFAGERADGSIYTGRSLYCECDFTPGVGYQIKEGDDRFYVLDGPKHCLCRKTAIFFRQLQLRSQYLARYKDDEDAWWGDEFILGRHVGDIIMDLIERAKAGEFIGEDSGGAGFWGGYFYLQTVAVICDKFIGHLWNDVYQLCADKKISLEGAVIQDYREPPPPQWVPEIHLAAGDGWVGIASLPGNRSMAKEWKLEVLKPDGTPAYSFLPGEGLMHDPVFGPDIEDTERARTRLEALIAQAKKRAAPTPELAPAWADDDPGKNRDET